MCDLFETLGEIMKPETLTVKTRLVVLSHLSDAQEMCYMGQNADAVMRINFTKYIINYCNGNLNMEINPDILWTKFLKGRMNEERDKLKQLDMIECKLRDRNDCKWVSYNEPIYTKLYGMYGYITVSIFKVYFIYINGNDVSFDDITDRFEIKYIH